MMFLPKMVNYSRSFLLLSTRGTRRVNHSEAFLLSELFCGTPPSCLKVVGDGGGGLQDFSVSPSPLWVNLGF